MNVFLTLVILLMCGGAYLMYTQDQTKITALQQQLDDANARSKAAEAKAAAVTPVTPSSAPGTGQLPTPNGVAVTVKAPAPVILPTGPGTVATVAPDTSHSSAIDAAAAAATAAANSAGIGTFTTLDGHTYSNCKVLKVDQDGVTFSHEDGITKILFPLMPPNIQKLFNYDPQKAVAQTDAQIRYDQQQAALSNAAPAAPVVAPAAPASP
jgi:hypothetical protein